MRRIDLPTLRAAAWAARTLAAARRELRQGRVHDIELGPPPRLPSHAVRGVRALLRRRSHTCLEEALVLQRWEVAHGTYRDIVIGVTAPDEHFGAHAWLDGDQAEAQVFTELTRLKPRVCT